MENDRLNTPKTDSINKVNESFVFLHEIEEKKLVFVVI